MRHDPTRTLPAPCVERVAAPARLGPPPGGLDRRGDCGRLGCDPRSRQPVAEEGARRRRRRAAGPHPARPDAETDRRATCGAPQLAGPRGRSLRFLGRRVDDQARRRRDPARVWGELPSGACQSPPPGVRLDRAEAHPPRHAAGRSGDRRVDRRALAGASSKAQSERRTVLWVDESAFYPLAGVVRTYAPRGETPLLHAPLTRDHLSAISALTPDGRLLLTLQERPFRGPDIVRFLQHLLRHVPGKLLVIWDGAPIHRARVVKDFLARGAAARLQLEQLPGYAPELNPDEGIWHYLKQVELRNLCCDDLAELRVELGLAVKRLRRKRHVLQGCIAQCGYAA